MPGGLPSPHRASRVTALVQQKSGHQPCAGVAGRTGNDAVEIEWKTLRPAE
jgi:hypothetical protein